MKMLFLCRSDLKRYAGVLDRLQKQMNLGIDQYPLTLPLAFDLLVRESGTFSNNNFHQSNGGNGFSAREESSINLCFFR